MNKPNPSVDGFLRKSAQWREELQVRLDETPVLAAAFAALTPGRQRAYLLHFSAAKQSKTRAARVEKWMAPILKGKGLDE